MRMARFCRFAACPGKGRVAPFFAYCALARGAAWSGSAADNLGRDENP
jgi:hypothetical protein